MAASKPDKEALYFLAVIPPSPLVEEAWQLKEYFRDRYHSKASLNSPPHITLHMPFKWRADREAVLIEQLAGFKSPVEIFSISLNNFNNFPPRVIFIDVAHSESLHQLQHSLQRFCQQKLQRFNADYKDQPFHPHITLAFRDLKRPMFEQAWAEFSTRTFQGSFVVSAFTLLKHNGKEWKKLKDISLA